MEAVLQKSSKDYYTFGSTLNVASSLKTCDLPIPVFSKVKRVENLYVCGGGGGLVGRG